MEAEAYLLDYARKHGTTSWNALDMAVHTKKFADIATSSLAVAEAREKVAENEEKTVRAERRARMRARAAECAEFQKKWLEEGKKNWKRNMRVRKEREQRILVMEAEKIEKKEAARERKKKENEVDLCSGLEWFENNMQSLGIEEAQQGCAVLPTSPDYKQRIKARLEDESSRQKSEEYMAWIKKKGAQSRVARREREKRRQRMLRDQEREKLVLDEKKKAEKTKLLVRHYYRAVLAVTISKWRKATQKIRKQLERATRAVETKRKFEAECTEAFEKFCVEARRTAEAAAEVQSRIHQVKRMARDRKRKKATLVCQEVVEKLLDLTCCVLRERGEDRGVMSVVDWRHIKERFVSPHPFFKKRMHTVVIKGQDPQADNDALTEIEEFTQDCGHWAVVPPASIHPPPSAPPKDPVPKALATLRQLASEQISTRPDKAEVISFDEKRVRLCVTGRVPPAVVTAACDRYRLFVVTIEAVVDRALQLAAEENAAASRAQLRENGLKLKSARDSEEDDVSDLLLVDTLVSYLEEEVDETTSWALVGFPRTRIQAKLLEHRLCGYSDPEVEEVVAAPKKKKKNSDATPKMSPFDAVYVVQDEDLATWWSSHTPRTISEKTHANNSQRIEENVEILVEVCHKRHQDEETSLSEDVNVGIQSRIATLSPMQRLWRSHVLEERCIDLDSIRWVLNAWRSEDDWYCGCLESFVYGIREQSQILQQEVKELSDERKLDGKREVVEYAQDHASVLASHLIEAEASRFLLAIRLLDEHAKLLCDEDSEAACAGIQLSNSIQSAKEIASRSSRARIGERVEEAMNVLTPLLPALEEEELRAVAGWHFVRRLQSTVTRLNAVTTWMSEL